MRGHACPISRLFSARYVAHRRRALLILNACAATVTDGWCPTAACTTGAGTARPVCCCERPGPTAHRRCCCSTGRRGVIRVGRGVCRAAPATAMRPPSRPPSARRTRRPGCPASGFQCGPPSSPPAASRHALDLHHRRRRRGRTAAHRAQPGKRRTALGRRGRGGRPAAAPRVRRQLATAAHRTGDRAVESRRRAAAPPAAHGRDRGGRLRVVHRGQTRPRAVAAESRISSLLQAPN